MRRSIRSFKFTPPPPLPPGHLNFWKFSPRKEDKMWFQPKCYGIRCIYQTLLWCLNSWLNQRSARSMACNFFSHGLEYFKNWCNLHLFFISRYLQFDTEKGRNYNMPTSPRGLRHTLGVYWNKMFHAPKVATQTD